MEKLENIARNTEIITLEELQNVLNTKKEPTAYIGFEPSGIVHIGWKICINKIRELTDAGFNMTILLADWHAYINDKLGSNIENIRTCGKYMEDCFMAFGINQKRTKFVYATDLVDKREYWEKVIKISKQASLSRIKRSMTIMGRKEEESETDSSKVIYPLMQVADIFQLDVDVALGGMDQRKAHMLARDIAEKLHWKKPIAIHTPLLTGLDKGGRMDPVEAKMSKSNPDSCVYIHDSKEEIKRKINNAVCAEGIVENNPILDMCKYIIFPEFSEMKIERPPKYGGDMLIKNYDELENLYKNKQLHPLDLKNTTARYLNDILEPVRKYFAEHPENYERMKAMKITR
ncbi:MAG: tyrosine--tRNA ligase [Thermoplasmata archaeon]